MDPDANLAQQLRLSCFLVEAEESGREVSAAELSIKSMRLAELVLALNEWLARGGALPEAWKR